MDSIRRDIMARKDPTNAEIADLLEQIADLLEGQDSNPYRVRAYRTGAGSLRATKEPVAEYVHKGDKQALEDIPGIGERLARLIEEFVTTGRSNLLERLQGEVSPETVFARVPGIGDELAARIADKLDIDTLEELEQAAYDGRLDAVEGFGKRRVEAVKTALAGMLTRSAARRSRNMERSAVEPKAGEPSVEQLLEIDAEYRKRAEKGELKTIAPRRFNPTNEAWLPVMHLDRDGWSYTVLYSNTARAHELDKTRDWVVIYFERDGKEKQRTVVTATTGALKGQRVVRGREDELVTAEPAHAGD
jgi:DNA polymerase (family 10)